MVRPFGRKSVILQLESERQRRMEVQIERSWKAHLEPEFAKPYFAQLTEAVRQEYAAFPCYPPGRLVFNAVIRLCAAAAVLIAGRSAALPGVTACVSAPGRAGAFRIKYRIAPVVSWFFYTSDAYDETSGGGLVVSGVG